MDENLTNFVNLLNRQRQREPLPQELSGLPNWAQREFAKRPETVPPKQAEATNGVKHDAEPKSEIVFEAKRADAAPTMPLAEPPVVAGPSMPRETALVDAPPQAKRVIEIVPPVAKANAEILPPAAKGRTPKSLATDIDPKRDPEAWLARFLAEETATRQPAAPKPAASATAPAVVDTKADNNVDATKRAQEFEPAAATAIGAEKKTEAATAETKAKAPTDAKKIETLAADDTSASPPVIAGAAEIVPLQPFIAEAMASPHAGRRPVAFALAAAAVIAVVALVVGAYWYTHSEPELTASVKPNAPTVAPAKPTPTLAKNAAKPVAPTLPKTAAQRAVPTPKTAAAKPASPPTQKLAAAMPGAPATTVAAKPAEKPKLETKAAAPLSSPNAAKASPAPAPGKPPAPVVAQVQKTPERPSMPAAAKLVAPPAPAPAVAPKSTTPASTQIAMLPNVTQPAVNPPAPANPAPVSVPGAAGAATSTGEPMWQRNAIPAPPFSGQPQIAIVIDDLGLDRGRTERAIALDGPVTLSFLAYASDLPNQTAAARKAGHELIVHVPMEPIVKPKYVAQTAGANPAHTELLRRLRWDLSRFTGYVGVNNHMGNSLSSDADSTQTVIAELKTRGLLFLDTHVAGAGVMKAAAREGVPTVTRDVLLDDDVTASSVTERLAELETIARQRGTAIAIGHPHDLTLTALKVWIAGLPSKGLQLVPLTAVVRHREQHVASGGAG